MDIDTALNKLVVSLQPSDPYKIILFGSHANGTPNEHSDIDLMVILDNDHVSKTYQERLDKRVYVRTLVLDINEEVSLDLLVYSKAELEKVKEYGNTFVIDIEKTGKVIYEKPN